MKTEEHTTPTVYTTSSPIHWVRKPAYKKDKLDLTSAFLVLYFGI